MTKTRRLLIAALVSLIASLAVAASSQAVPVRWWVKKPGPSKELPVAPYVETLTSKGNIVLYEHNSPTKGAKCKVIDEEHIENPANPLLSGEDEMVSFEGECHGAAIFPCTVAEKFEFEETLPWRSELIPPGPEDHFIAPKIEIECDTSHLTEVYTELTPLEPKVAVNALDFLGPASGILNAGAHEIYFKGKDKLKAAKFLKVKAK